MINGENNVMYYNKHMSVQLLVNKSAIKRQYAINKYQDQVTNEHAANIS